MQLFEMGRMRDGDHMELTLSALEVYNQHSRDLLGPVSAASMREPAGAYGVAVPNIHELQQDPEGGGGE